MARSGSAPAARSTICTTRAASPAALGIPHYIVNFERQFDEHGGLELRARVRRRADADPVRALQRRPEVRDARGARRGLGAELVATGHYARVERDEARPVSC